MQIVRGQKVKISDFTSSNRIDVLVHVETRSRLDVDVSCFGLDETDQLSDDRYLVFYNQKSSPCGSIMLEENNEQGEARFLVDLSGLPTKISKMVFIATIDGDVAMSSITKCLVRICGDGKELASFQLSGEDFTTEKAVMLAELYRKSEWRFYANGQGFRGGMEALVRHFGGEVEAPMEQPTSFSMSEMVQTVKTAPECGDKMAASLGNGKQIQNEYNRDDAKNICQEEELNRRLLQAAINGSDGTVNELLTAGADCNTRNGEGFTPLLLAIKHNPDIKVCEKLFAVGPFVEFPTHYSPFKEEMLRAINIVHKTGVASASRMQREMQIDFMKAAEIINILDDLEIVGPQDGARGRSILVKELEAHKKLEKYFSEKELSEIEMCSGNYSKSKINILMLSTKNKNVEIFNLLLNKFNSTFISIMQTDSNGGGDLLNHNSKFSSCLVKKDEIIRTLASYKDRHDNTLLMGAGSAEIVAHLLSGGADVNARNKKGLTSLMFARDEGIAKALLAAGADVNARDHEGKTALMHAEENERDTVVQALREAGAKE